MEAHFFLLSSSACLSIYTALRECAVMKLPWCAFYYRLPASCSVLLSVFFFIARLFFYHVIHPGVYDAFKEFGLELQVILTRMAIFRCMGRQIPFLIFLVMAFCFVFRVLMWLY